MHGTRYTGKRLASNAAETNDSLDMQSLRRDTTGVHCLNMSVIRERMSSSEGRRSSYRLVAYLVRCRSSQLLVAFLLLSAVLRVAAAIYLGDKIVDLPGTADQISYHTLALRILQQEHL